MSVERIPVADRQQWLALRRQDVTASDVAAACGCSPFKTALQLWAEKTGVDLGDEDSALMRRGRHLEDAVLNYYREENPGHMVTKPGLYLRDPAQRIGATPDAVVTTGIDDVVLQCKVVAKPVFDREWSDGPPLHYQLQVLTETMLWGAARGMLAVLAIDAFGAEFQTFQVTRHPAAEDRIREAVAQFWADIGEGRQPRADYSRDAALLSMLNPPNEKAPPLDLAADNRMPALLAEYETAKSAEKAARAEIEALRAEIIDKLGTASLATLPGWKVSHRMQDRKAYTVAAASYPVLKVTRLKEYA